MENIILPKKIEFTKGAKPNEGIITVEPCYYGYGITLGNALRRVLLSSLPGAAVTAVKIQGVDHEFSSIPHVKEDVVEIILNLKNLRFKIFSSEVVRLQLRAKGEKIVTAKDIEPSSDVEIINKDLPIATLTDSSAKLEMEIFVSQGRGYVPTEEKKEEREIGVIAIDSIFTPIVNVGFKVDNVRVGEVTNYDKLILTIETDGTITPEEACRQSAEILINHFNLILGKPAEEEKSAAGEEAISEEAESEEKAEVLGEEVQEKKRGRGRPKKDESVSVPTAVGTFTDAKALADKPSAFAKASTFTKVTADKADKEEKVKKKRGRPKKEESAE